MAWSISNSSHLIMWFFHLNWLISLVQIGSTEWVEENKQMLTSKVVAYLNVDTAVAGAGFEASATPQLDELLIEAAKRVLSLMNGIFENHTINSNSWMKNFSCMTYLQGFSESM